VIRGGEIGSAVVRGRRGFGNGSPEDSWFEGRGPGLAVRSLGQDGVRERQSRLLEASRKGRDGRPGLSSNADGKPGTAARFPGRSRTSGKLAKVLKVRQRPCASGLEDRRVVPVQHRPPMPFSSPRSARPTRLRAHPGFLLRLRCRHPGHPLRPAPPWPGTTPQAAWRPGTNSSL
jgi:hypothetical protein